MTTMPRLLRAITRNDIVDWDDVALPALGVVDRARPPPRPLRLIRIDPWDRTRPVPVWLVTVAVVMRVLVVVAVRRFPD
jgi:hypothetical protein